MEFPQDSLSTTPFLTSLLSESEQTALRPAANIAHHTMWSPPPPPLPLQLRRPPPPPTQSAQPHRRPLPPPLGPRAAPVSARPRRPPRLDLHLAPPHAPARPLRPRHRRLHPHPVPLPRRRGNPEHAAPPLRGPPLPLGPPRLPRPRAPRPRTPPAALRRRPRRGRRVVLHAGHPRRALRQAQAPGGVRRPERRVRGEGVGADAVGRGASRGGVQREHRDRQVPLRPRRRGRGRGGGLDLWPPELRQDIDHWYGLIYPSVNNGVYRCGFAQSQEAYDAAAEELFATLDRLEDHLSSSRYLCGDRLTLADVCLFTTLIRFDLVYNSLFRCTMRKLVEYPSLHAYTRDIYQMPKVAETCDMGAIAEGYFKILFPLNPGGIQPVAPVSCGSRVAPEAAWQGGLVLPAA